MSRIQAARKDDHKFGEERINITNESIANMKTLKFYQLTETFKKEIEKKTRAEIEHSDKMKYLHYMLGGIMTIFPNSMKNVSLYMNTQLGRTVDLPTAFTILMLFDNVTGPLSQIPHIWN